jgi:hypothetical protein
MVSRISAEVCESFTVPYHYVGFYTAVLWIGDCKEKSRGPRPDSLHPMRALAGTIIGDCGSQAREAEIVLLNKVV